MRSRLAALAFAARFFSALRFLASRLRSIFALAFARFSAGVSAYAFALQLKKENNRSNMTDNLFIKNMQENSRGTILLLWSHLGLNQGPPDYESGATNQLSYGTSRACAFRYAKLRFTSRGDYYLLWRALP